LQKPDLANLWESLENLIRQAGEAIMQVRISGQLELEYKDGKFPLTKADLDSNQILLSGLSTITPEIPVVSEECPQPENEKLITNEYYWCIDPLDGTANFVQGSDQFTVCLGLIGPEGPIAGMVYAPALDELYLGETTAQAWMKSASGIQELAVTANTSAKIVVGNKLNLNEKTANFVSQLGQVEFRQYGSTIKQVAIARGQADIYPRFAPTMEWDTAATHAIIKAAGGQILGLDGSELKYRKPNLFNPGFICYNGTVDLPDIAL
jgi:3'(2'), 5'-bisphosphate nucleotidase